MLSLHPVSFIGATPNASTSSPSKKISFQSQLNADTFKKSGKNIFTDKEVLINMKALTKRADNLIKFKLDERYPKFNELLADIISYRNIEAESAESKKWICDRVNHGLAMLAESVPVLKPENRQEAFDKLVKQMDTKTFYEGIDGNDGLGDLIYSLTQKAVGSLPEDTAIAKKAKGSATDVLQYKIASFYRTID
jgi:hypothetical protein